MSRHEYNNDTARSIAHSVSAFRNSRVSLPTTCHHANAKLLARSLSPEDIERRRASFSTNGDIDPTAILANYELLQGIKYLDKLADHDHLRSGTRVVVSIFRGAEICFLNLASLFRSARNDVAAGEWGHSAVKLTWVNYFTETLYRLSQLVIRIDAGSADGDSLSVEGISICGL